MDQISTKTPNPKCRLYLCLIEFIDWRNSQSRWYFQPLLWTSAPLTFSLVHFLPFPPFRVNKYSGTYVFIQFVTGGGGGGGGRVSSCVESIYRSVFDQIPNLQKCFTTPNKKEGRGPETNKHLYRPIFKNSRHLGFGVYYLYGPMSLPMRGGSQAGKLPQACQKPVISGSQSW